MHGCRKGYFLKSMEVGKRRFCYPLMQEKIDLSYPQMQEKEVSAIHGCCKGKFLLFAIHGSADCFCYPWIEGLFLPSMDAGKESFCYP